MIRISAAVASAILLITSALSAQGSDTDSSTIGVSKVRIVRLSEVKGEVQFDVNGGQGFEHAMPNLPIVEQSRLQTGAGVAEVEFEDNSTMRLAPDTLVEFPRLELLASGAKASTVHVLKGMVYVSLVNTRGNDFVVLFGQQKLQIPPSSHIRLQLEPNEAKLAVLEGSIQVDGPSGAVEVPKKKTVTFPLADPAQPEVAKNVAPEPYDSWDHDSAGYHKQFAASNALSATPYSYGASDMMYYGAFSDAGGCGSMWHPYFTSASWEPYSNGAWAYYPNAGYSWVSPYPWAWTPYHSGNWSYCNGSGWGWQPGSTWNGLSNAGMMTLKAGTMPRAPIHPPLQGQGSLVVVNSKPLNFSALGKEDSFVFRKDSAGLGVPRGSLGNLEKFSQHSIEHGTVTTHVYSEAPSSAMNRQSASNAAMAPSTIHRGYALPATSAASEANTGFARGATQNGAMTAAPTSTSTMHASSGSSSSSGGHPH